MFCRHRELRHPHGHLDPPLIFAGNLTRAQHRQGFAQIHVGAGSLVKQAIQLIADTCQFQSRQHFCQLFVCVIHHQPPPAIASYSDNGRSNSDGRRSCGPAEPPLGAGGPQLRDASMGLPLAPATPSKCTGSIAC